MTLYQITDDFLRLLELAQDPEVDPDVIKDTLDGIQGELEDKADSYAVVIKELEAEEAKFQAEITRLTKTKKKITENIEKVKENLLAALIATENRKLTTEHFKFSVAKNGGKNPMWLDDIEKIPKEYILQKPEVDKEKIREALDSGKKLDFAHFEERGVHLSIK